MTTHITKTWFDGEKVVTQEIPESEVYKQEPVAQIIALGQYEFPGLEWLSADHSFRAPIGTLLYTTPQPCPTCEALARTVMMDQTAHDTQRQPLTDEEIRKFADTHLFYQPEGYEVSGIFNLARAIEAAHGIGEKT